MIADPLMRKVLADLELISHGTTQAWNSDGRGGNSERWGPPGCIDPPHLFFRGLWLAALDDARRRSVRTEAENTLKEIRGHGVDRSHVSGETRADEETRMLKTGQGFTADEVAVRFHCTPTRVRRVRLAGGYRVDDGRPPVAQPDEVEHTQRARQLRDNGMSIGAIALTLGRSKSTIHAYLAMPSAGGL